MIVDEIGDGNCKGRKREWNVKDADVEREPESGKKGSRERGGIGRLRTIVNPFLYSLFSMVKRDHEINFFV